MISVRIRILKFSDFQLRSARRSLDEPCADTDTIYEVARGLLRKIATGSKAVRLVGVSVSGLTTGGAQGTLFVDPHTIRRGKLQAVSNEISRRFGRGQLTRATLLGND